jgi:hypothetical protein
MARFATKWIVSEYAVIRAESRLVGEEPHLRVSDAIFGGLHDGIGYTKNHQLKGKMPVD